MAHNGDFYPRPPGGGRRTKYLKAKCVSPISIHALRVEGDRLWFCSPWQGAQFLSTPSGWRATVSMSLCEKRSFYFYPRPPGGGRRMFWSTAFENRLFLSTPSGWRATKLAAFLNKMLEISIHALRVEGDEVTRKHVLHDKISIHALRVEGDNPLFPEGFDLHYFYPRPPGGGRPQNCGLHSTRLRFLSTPSGWRATTSFSATAGSY